MHELGIVFHIIKKVEEVAAENAVSAVNSVTLEIGEVSTTVDTYLQDCWKWAAAKSDYVKDAKLLIETIPAVTMCDSCKRTYETVKYGKTCPYCGSEDTYLVTGNEVSIKEIEAI